MYRLLTKDKNENQCPAHSFNISFSGSGSIFSGVYHLNLQAARTNEPRNPLNRRVSHLGEQIMDDGIDPQWALLWAREDTGPNEDVDEILALATRYLEFLVSGARADEPKRQS